MKARDVLASVVLGLALFCADPDTVFAVSERQLVTGACIALGMAWLAFSLGAIHEKDRASRSVYRNVIDAAKTDPVIQEMAADVRRRAQMRKLGLVVHSGGRERGPFGGRVA